MFVFRFLYRLYNLYFSAERDFARKVQRLTGFVPSRLPLFRLAFAHKSGSGTREGALPGQTNNERLEYLGDAVLGTVVAEYLFKKYPDADEGFLTKMRSKIVKRKSLNQIGDRMGLTAFLQEQNKTRLSSSMLGNAVEALVGAVYLERGYRRTQTFIVHRILKLYVDMNELETTDDNYKSQLLEACQKQGKSITYKLISKYKQDRRDRFQVGVIIAREQVSTADDYNKKAAEQLASLKALEKLGLLEPAEAPSNKKNHHARIIQTPDEDEGRGGASRRGKDSRRESSRDERRDNGRDSNRNRGDESRRDRSADGDRETTEVGGGRDSVERDGDSARGKGPDASRRDSPQIIDPDDIVYQLVETSTAAEASDGPRTAFEQSESTDSASGEQDPRSKRKSSGKRDSRNGRDGRDHRGGQLGYHVRHGIRTAVAAAEVLDAFHGEATGRPIATDQQPGDSERHSEVSTKSTPRSSEALAKTRAPEASPAVENALEKGDAKISLSPSQNGDTKKSKATRKKTRRRSPLSHRIDYAAKCGSVAVAIVDALLGEVASITHPPAQGFAEANQTPAPRPPEPGLRDADLPKANLQGAKVEEPKVEKGSKPKAEHRSLSLSNPALREVIRDAAAGTSLVDPVAEQAPVATPSL